MILICGIRSESPIDLLLEELNLIGADFIFWNQRKFNQTKLLLEVTETGIVKGELIYEGKSFSLEKFKVIYSRMSDWNTLPEIEENADDEHLKNKCERIHVMMQTFIDHSQGTVINRSGDMMSNNSKPYQLFLAKEAGIKIPDTCITTNEKTALDFYHEKKQDIIYKSISGTRSIVMKLLKKDLPRLKKLFFCPTQFQEFVVGNNLRVHVINNIILATLIHSEATDYRYTTKSGAVSPVLSHVELRADRKLKCISFSKQLKLFFSGLDFKQNREGELTCFEANPMPGYSYYEKSTSQPIAYTLACEMKRIDDSIT